MSDNVSTPNTAPTDASATDAVDTQEAVDTTVEDGVPVEQDANQLKEIADKAAESIRKKYKVKVDGSEVEVDEDELLRGYQRAKSAAKRFEEAAKMKKEAEQLSALLKSDTADAIKRSGGNPQEWAEKFLAGIYEEEELAKKDPKELEIRKLKKQLEEVNKKETDKKAKEEQDQHAKLLTQYEADYTKQITSALEKSGLPKTPFTVKRMAQYMARAMDAGMDIAASDVVDYVKEDYINDFKGFFSQSNEDLLMQVLGKENADKIRRAELKKIKEKTPPTPTATKPVANAKPEEDQKPKKKMTMKEFRDSMKNEE